MAGSRSRSTLLHFTLLAPFSPRLWAAAAGWSTRDSIFSLALICAVFAAVVAVHRGVQVRRELLAYAAYYDEHHPAVVVQNGEVSVEGGGTISIQDSDETLLVDPQETVQTSEIETPRSLVIRRREVLRRDGSHEQILPVAELQQQLGLGDFRVDGTAIREFADTHAIAITAAVAGVSLAFLGPWLFVGSLISAVLAAGLVRRLRWHPGAPELGPVFRVALAVTGLTVVLSSALRLLAIQTGLAGGILWLLFVAAMTSWQTRRPTDLVRPSRADSS